MRIINHAAATERQAGRPAAESASRVRACNACVCLWVGVGCMTTCMRASVRCAAAAAAPNETIVFMVLARTGGVEHDGDDGVNGACERAGTAVSSVLIVRPDRRSMCVTPAVVEVALVVMVPSLVGWVSLGRGTVGGRFGPGAGDGPNITLRAEWSQQQRLQYSLRKCVRTCVK